MEAFSIYGIDYLTLLNFGVGLSNESRPRNEEFTVPILNKDGLILDILKITNLNTTKGIINYRINGLIGGSQHQDIIVCDDFIDLLFAFQQGYNNAVMIADPKSPPTFMDKYDKITFINSDHPAIDIIKCPIYTYGISELSIYLKSKKLSDTIPVIVQYRNENTYLFKNPSLVEGKLYWLTTFRKYVLGPKGLLNATKAHIEGRLMQGEKDLYYWKVTPVNYYNSNYSHEEPRKLFEDLSEKLYVLAACLSKIQCQTIALYLMYMYTWINFDYNINLHIICPSDRLRKYLIALMVPLMPTMSSFYSRGTPTMITLVKETYYRAETQIPVIIFDDFADKNFDKGLSLFVHHSFLGKDIRPFSNTQFFKDLNNMRTRLLNFSLDFPLKTEEYKGKSVIGDLLAPIYNMAIQCGLKDIRLIQWSILQSRRIIKTIHKDDLKFLGLLDEEDVELKSLNIKPEQIH
jgi:hypothetical protein